MTEHSPQQLEALDKVRRWFMAHQEYNRSDGASERPSQVFRLFGYAGTGKTTLAKTIREGKQITLFAAYTGKAAQVLTRKGVPASTLHRLIYKPRGERIEYQRDKDGLLILDADHKPIPVPGAKSRPAFALDPDSPLLWADLLVVDEVSMVNKELGEDILSFGKPVLVLGDPAQLPPVEGGGYFTAKQPDVLLTEIHRQAEGSEVLRIATAIRHGEGVAKVPACDYLSASRFGQVICGTNNMRWEINEEVRAAKGMPEGRPVPGDKLIVLQNNSEFGVRNGETFEVVEYDAKEETCVMADDDGYVRELPVWGEAFTRYGEKVVKDKPYGEQIARVMATFAWAITCHKSQGSQWDTVLVVDESHVFRRDRQKWLYTAVTRAAEEVHVVNPGGMYAKPTPRVKPRPRRK